MGRPGGTQASPGLRVVGVHSVGVWGPALAAAAESREWAESGMARKPPPQLVGQRVPTRTLLAPPGSSGSWSALPVVLTGQDPLCTFPACRTRVAEAALGAFWTWGVDYSRKSPAGSTLVAPTSWQPRLSGRGGSGVSAPWWPLGLQQEPGESPASGQLGSGCYCPTAFVSNRDTNRSSPFTRPLPEGTQLAGVGALPAWVSRGGRPGSRAPPEAGVHGGVWGASRLS